MCYIPLETASKEFLVKAYESVNSESTIEFLKYLQAHYPKQRLALFGDGASYHRSAELKAYLQSVNQDLAEDEWAITCTRFAPNAPERSSGRRHLVTGKTLHPPMLPPV